MTFEQTRRADIRNVAIIAHVDHGKTTLVDGMLRQSGVFRANEEVAERVMDSTDLEREKGITILAKNTAVHYGDLTINIVDTPGHADFGGEVERALTMVDGVLLLVDASEGPLPQTRFVLRKSLEAHLPVVLVVNKVDRPDARPAEVLDDVYDLFIDLGADDEHIAFPVVYCNARSGQAALTPEEVADAPDLKILFELLIEYIPAPAYIEGHPFQALVCNLDASPYVGRLAICRVHQGWVRKGDTVAWCRQGDDGAPPRVRVAELYMTDGLQRIDAGPRGAGPGDIIAVAGIPEIMIGDTLADATDPRPLPGVTVDEPAISMTIGINTGPLAGKEGTKLTARLLKGRLDSELVGNVSIRVMPTARPDTWEVQGRGELALAVLVELMRREGFELTAGKPQVLTKIIDGKVHEPVERVSLDIPEELLGTVMQLLAGRKGRMQHVTSHGSGWARTDWLVPSGTDRASFAAADRDEGHSPAPSRPGRVGTVVRRNPYPPKRLARCRPAREDRHVRPDEPAGARDNVRRARCRGLRGNDRGRKRPPRGHGREPDQRAQADQHAIVHVRGAGPFDARAGPVVGTGARVPA